MGAGRGGNVTEFCDDSAGRCVAVYRERSTFLTSALPSMKSMSPCDMRVRVKMEPWRGCADSLRDGEPLPVGMSVSPRLFLLIETPGCGGRRSDQSIKSPSFPARQLSRRITIKEGSRDCVPGRQPVSILKYGGDDRLQRTSDAGRELIKGERGRRDGVGGDGSDGSGDSEESCKASRGRGREGRSGGGSEAGRPGSKPDLAWIRS